MEVQSRGISFHPMFIHSPPSLLWQVFEDKGHSCLFVSETAVTHVPDTGTQQTKEREREVNLSVTNRSITWEILGEKEILPFLFVFKNTYNIQQMPKDKCDFIPNREKPK